MKYYEMSKEEIFNHLHIDETVGMTDEQVKNSMRENGLNEFSRTKKQSLVKRILSAVSEPMIIILFLAVVISIGMNIYQLYHDMHYDFVEGIAIFIAASLSVGITVFMEGRSTKAFEALNKINDDSNVKVLRNGQVQLISKKNIVVGDLIKLNMGDKVPADCRVLTEINVKVNESMLTGESEEVEKNRLPVELSENANISMFTNMIFGGTFVTAGECLAIVTEVGDQTRMGAIASALKDSEATLTPLQTKLNKLAKWITIFGAIASGLIFLFEVFKAIISGNVTFDHIQNAFMTGVSLIVAAVPEGLPTIVAIVLAINVIKMAKINALVRKLVACETVGCINIICSDKTGTLTQNKMSVIHIYQKGELAKTSHVEDQFLKENFAFNSTADLSIHNGDWETVGNATEGALLATIKKEYKTIRESKSIAHRMPFSSEKKCMITVSEEKEGQRVFIKGSPEKIISMCLFEDDTRVAHIYKEMEKLQKEAKRILAFCHKDVDDYLNCEMESGMIFDGFVAIADPVRADAFDAVQKCAESGINIKMLTGDNIVTARAIGQELGILEEDSIVIEAAEIEKLSDHELSGIIDRIRIIARSMPGTKMRIVNLLKSRGNVVAVTGDGINDAPALKNADVGIAMGKTGTEVSKEASDIILLDDSFSTIVKAIEWGKGIYENFQRFIQFQLTVNLVAVLTVILCEILGREVPFTTIQLLWVNLIMDGPPALSLGLEAVRKNIMKDKPIERDAPILTSNMFFNIGTNGVFIVIMMMALIVGNPLNVPPQEQLCVVFVVFVLFQLFNAFNARVLTGESIFKNILNNRIMLLMILATFIIQILITQFGGYVFRTVALDVDVWIKMLLYSCSVVVFSEGVKLIRRAWKKNA